MTDDATTRPPGQRLLAAWSASGMPLGRLLVRALNRESIDRARVLSEVTDEALVEMVERYVTRTSRGQKVRAPGPPADRCIRCGDKIKDWEPGDFCWQVANGHVHADCADATGKPLPYEA